MWLLDFGDGHLAIRSLRSACDFHCASPPTGMQICLRKATVFCQKMPVERCVAQSFYPDFAVLECLHLIAILMSLASIYTRWVATTATWRHVLVVRHEKNTSQHLCCGLSGASKLRGGTKAAIQANNTVQAKNTTMASTCESALGKGCEKYQVLMHN